VSPTGPTRNGPPRLFDRALLRVRRRRAEARGAATFLLDRAVADLAERLQAVNRRFALALDLGTSGNRLASALATTGRIDRLVGCEPLAAARNAQFLRVVGDEETLPFADATFDLVVSALALHWTNDLPGVLAQVRRALKPDGLFLAVLAGGDTLTELRQCLAAAESELDGGASPRVAPFIDVRTLGSLLQRAGFALPVTDLDRVTVRYPNLSKLLHDLRGMGATNVLLERRRTPLRRTTLARTVELYAERFADADGKLRATFDLVSISGWAPAAGQQQPLKPGSAKARLADALGTREQSAGEKAGPQRGG
jgi:SAM-dependent methyltransferase